MLVGTQMRNSVLEVWQHPAPVAFRRGITTYIPLTSPLKLISADAGGLHTDLGEPGSPVGWVFRCSRWDLEWWEASIGSPMASYRATVMGTI